MGMRKRRRKRRRKRKQKRKRIKHRILFMNLKYQVFLIGTCLVKTLSVKLQL